MSIINPAIGGVLIGLAAVLMMFAIGRICGISGILGGATKNLIVERLEGAKDHTWRWLFLLGLMIGPLFTHQFLLVDEPSAIDASWALVIASGLLVGVGTKLGSGCTSGHGVCGMARLSVRSVAATITFMLSGIITVYLVRHVF